MYHIKTARTGLHLSRQYVSSVTDIQMDRLTQIEDNPSLATNDELQKLCVLYGIQDTPHVMLPKNITDPEIKLSPQDRLAIRSLLSFKNLYRQRA